MIIEHRLQKQYVGSSMHLCLQLYSLCIAVTDWMFRPWTILGLLTGIALLVFYIVGYFISDPYQFRLTGALVEALLVLAMVAWNSYLYHREQKMTLYEMTNRATTIIEALERSGMNMVQV